MGGGVGSGRNSVSSLLGVGEVMVGVFVVAVWVVGAVMVGVVVVVVWVVGLGVAGIIY